MGESPTGSFLLSCHCRGVLHPEPADQRCHIQSLQISGATSRASRPAQQQSGSGPTTLNTLQPSPVEKKTSSTMVTFIHKGLKKFHFKVRFDGFDDVLHLRSEEVLDEFLFSIISEVI